MLPSKERSPVCPMEAQTAPVCRIRNLTTAFRVDRRWIPVVRDLSFDIGPRETVAVVGESGSGKSVTALSVMRLLPATNSRIQGSVVLNGRSLTELDDEEMRRVRGDEISMIFQEPMTSLNPVLTIGFQVAEALRYHRDMTEREADAETLRLLDLVRIPNAAARFRDYPHQFSGGMRQRVMIAMALACRPSLLIADEPTTALDVTIQAQILDLIKMLQQEIGMSVMFITHDMGVVAEMAERIVVMYRGEKVEEGDATDVFAAPRHGYTRSLLAAVPKLGAMHGEAKPRCFEIIRMTAEDVQSPSEARPVRSKEPGPSEAEAPLLSVRDLTTRFDIRKGIFNRLKARVHAVEGVSFDVGHGETLALVGESGCGKSTIGRSLLRLVEPTAGSILFDGKDVTQQDKRAMRILRRDIQMIFQDPFASLNPRQMVGPAIAEPLLVHGLAGQAEADLIVVELLKRVGLAAEHALRYPHEFSGGQRQRLCIARALALKPKLIVADEAVSALDVSVQAQVMNLMMELQEQFGVSYLFISHDMAVVERVSHRVAVMHLGEIVEIGPRRSVFENPQHAYTKKLLSAVPVADPSRPARPIRLSTDEISSPIRTPGHEPERRRLIEIGDGHFVLSKPDL